MPALRRLLGCSLGVAAGVAMERVGSVVTHAPAPDLIDPRADALWPLGHVPRGVRATWMEEDDSCHDDVRACSMRLLQLRGHRLAAGSTAARAKGTNPEHGQRSAGAGATSTEGTAEAPVKSDGRVVGVSATHGAHASLSMAFASHCRDLVASASIDALSMAHVLHRFSLGASVDAGWSAELVLASLVGVSVLVCCGVCVAMAAMRVTSQGPSPRGARASDDLEDADGPGVRRTSRHRPLDTRRQWHRPPRAQRAGGSCC
mmetsp:Transcript_21897/g.62079  ORF Transcript_21897/g.62079 Transcript_21897/m.62079 type:complete len:260 (-) Transcript_21897:236-1015(-)